MTNKKIYRTAFTIVRYFRAEDKDEAISALVTIVNDTFTRERMEIDLSIIAEEMTEEDVKDLEVEDADDYLTGA